MCHGHTPTRLQKSRVLLQIGLKESKGSVRASRTRSTRASHALRACETRGKKNWLSVCHEFVLTIGLKNVVELSKIYSQLRPLCKFDTPGDWFRERIARVTFFALGFESSGRSNMSGSGSTPTKACSYPSKRERAELRASGNCRMCGCCFKTQFGNFNGDFKSEWISSEICFFCGPYWIKVKQRYQSWPNFW